MQGIVIDWVGHNARERGQALATVDLASGRRQTYAEMHDRVGRISDWLTSLGVGRGDRVGVLALNSTDTLDIIFATWRLGAVHLALNFRLTAEELDYIIGNAEPSVLVYDEALLDTVTDLTVEVPHRIAMDGLGGDTAFEQAIGDRTPILDMVALEPDDMCMLMYSSGTTGRPKGVVITHRMMLFSVLNASGIGRYSQDMVSLACMPLFHIGGLNVFSAPAIYMGGTAVIMRSFDPGATLAAFDDAELGVTHFLGVPAIFNALRDHPDNARTDFSRVEVMLAGAEAVPEPLVRWWLQRGVVIQEGYGMTENTASCCLIARHEMPAMIGSAGKAMRHTQIRVVREDGSDAEPGESGEIWCRGPTVTPGYWRREDANAETFVDGWLRTGDIGSMDANGFVYIEDRVKDMYISGGENVYPAEIENVLYELEAIREVAVIGVPDERWGEIGCAVVALHDGHELDLATIHGHCQGRLARFKLPGHLVLIEALPRNATGKVLKFELRQTVTV